MAVDAHFIQMTYMIIAYKNRWTSPLSKQEAKVDGPTIKILEKFSWQADHSINNSRIGFDLHWAMCVSPKQENKSFWSNDDFGRDLSVTRTTKKTVSGSNFKYYKQFYLSGYIYNKID